MYQCTCHWSVLSLVRYKCFHERKPGSAQYCAGPIVGRLRSVPLWRFARPNSYFASVQSEIRADSMRTRVNEPPYPIHFWAEPGLDRPRGNQVSMIEWLSKFSLRLSFQWKFHLFWLKRAFAILPTEFASTMYGTYIFMMIVHLVYSKIEISNDFDIDIDIENSANFGWLL